MNHRLKLVYLELEDIKDEILSSLKTYTSDQLSFTSSKDQWSMIQVVNHLILVESLTIKSIEKKMSSNKDLNDSTVYSQIRYFLIYLALKFKKKIKAPALLPVPTPDSSLEEVSANWAASRATLQTLLNKFSASDLNKDVFRHPLAGYLNIYQTLGFLREHLLHHKNQFKRIASNPDFIKV